jgi:hypothetical protein
VTWSYNDGKDALKGYQDTMSGVVDGATLNISSIEKGYRYESLLYINYIVRSSLTA